MEALPTLPPSAHERIELSKVKEAVQVANEATNARAILRRFKHRLIADRHRFQKNRSDVLEKIMSK